MLDALLAVLAGSALPAIFGGKKDDQQVPAMPQMPYGLMQIPTPAPNVQGAVDPMKPLPSPVQAGRMMEVQAAAPMPAASPAQQLVQEGAQPQVKNAPQPPFELTGENAKNYQWKWDPSQKRFVIEAGPGYVNAALAKQFERVKPKTSRGSAGALGATAIAGALGVGLPFLAARQQDKEARTRAKDAKASLEQLAQIGRQNIDDRITAGKSRAMQRMVDRGLYRSSTATAADRAWESERARELADLQAKLLAQQYQIDASTQSRAWPVLASSLNQLAVPLALLAARSYFGGGR